MPIRPKRSPSPFEQAFTLLEVLVSMAILTAGILSIIAIFPSIMKGNEAAELRTIGATLAMMKVEEIRRDDDENSKFMQAIKTLPAPTDPVPFASDPRLAYRISSTTMLYQHRDNSGAIVDDPADPRDNPNIPRIIIQVSPLYRPSNPVILDEYMFDE